MQLLTYLENLTGLSRAQLLTMQFARVRQDVDTGVYSVDLWNVSNVEPPTPAEIATAMAAPEPLSSLMAIALDLASSVSKMITTQITPDPAHSYAFQNAAAILNGNGDAVPTTEPKASKFAAMAAAYGATPAAFAAIVLAMQGAALDLGTALATFQTAAKSATTTAALATALTAYETAVSNVVTEINATQPVVPVVAPPAISIAGVNA